MEKRDIGRILPKSELVESGYLESMLDNFSTSYKLFWFKGIFAEVIKGNTEISYRRIVARMIAAAWYPVNYYNLSLGVSDKLSDAIRYLHTGLGVAKEIREDALVTVIEESGDKCLWKMINGFTGMVPYRLIRPFYESEIQYQKKTDLTFRDARVNAFIEQCNRSDDGAAFYRLDRKNRKLTVSPKWALYIRTNAALVEGWLNYKLIKYIQERNPNVPAIPFKLFAPTERDRNLSAQTKFWRKIQQEMPLYDLYTEQEFNRPNFDRYGKFSIDHFIPWSFVLHNEIWNLYPMFGKLNSAKSDRLPDKERYLARFCDRQYEAFLVAKKWDGVFQNLKEQYLNVKRDIFEIACSDRGHDAFVRAMWQTIEPLYQIANNQGFGIWWYEEEEEEEEEQEGQLWCNNQ